MRVFGNRRTWHVADANGLNDALAWRDARGGCFFCLTHDDEFPSLCIRVSGDVADVHYFPQDGHPGYRCLGGEGLPEGESTTLVYEGCDPGYGEETPNEFIVPFSTARSIARDFLVSAQMSPKASWFEL